MPVPRSEVDDYRDTTVRERREWLERQTGARLEHVGRYSFDPELARGNIEQFTGVAQVPLGFAGPLLVEGEHARGEFHVPLACTEGTLVASYNRGMKALHQSGGARCSVVDDVMQRAPVFQFADARAARHFSAWVQEHFDEVRAVAEGTSRVARLVDIDRYLASRFAYLRFDYTTGDAAGQNMVGKATYAACNWILQNYREHPILGYFLESNLATDKKSSMINLMRTRGKRVTAEAMLTREVLRRVLRVDPEDLERHAKVANVGAFLSGVNNNGCHAANAIAALFIATGQDVANVAESCAGIVYTELTGEGNLYLSITLPSLIVATHGGGTGLPTQRECLEALGCYGPGQVRKFAEIVAATVLAGELSLAAAISSQDWVSAHERMGRHR